MSPPGWPKEQIEALRVLFLAGDDDNEIAAKLSKMFGGSFTRSRVIGKRQRMGLYREGMMRTKSKPKKRQLTPPNPPAPAPAEPRTKPSRDRFLPVRAAEAKPARPSALLTEPHTVALPLMQRRQHQCGWPVNDGGPFLFCAQPKAAGDRHYCDYHRQLSLPAQLRRRRAA